MTRYRKIFVLFLTVVALSTLATSSMAQWLTPKTLQTGRARLVAVKAGNKIYFVGGFDGSNVQNKVDIYDDATGEITASNKPLNVARADLAGVYNENRNKMYFAGGQTNSSKSSVIEVFNLTTNNYDAQLSLPQPTAYLCAASYGDKILFAGGSNGSSYYDEIYVYNTLTGGAPQTYHLSEGRDQIAVTMIGSKVLMAGGHKGGGVYSDNIDIFDLANDQLISHSYQLSEARAFVAATMLDSKAYFGGGQKGSPNIGSTVVDVVDLDAPPGDIGPLQFDQPRYYLSATSVGTKVFFAGGGLGSTPYDAVDIFDISGGIPTTPTIEEHLSLARVNLVAASVGTKALFAGGIASGNNYSNVVNIYETETTPPLATTLDPADGATNVSYLSDLTLSFNEKIKKGTGDIIIKADGVLFATLPIATSGSVTILNNTAVKIDLDGFESESEITVEMLPGVIEDLAGNDFAGFTSGNPWNFTVETLVTLANVSTVETFEKDGPNKEVTLTVNDDEKIKEVKFISRGISADPEIWDEDPIESDGNDVYKVTLTNNDFSDPIGLQYYFEYTDLSDRVQQTPYKRTYIQYPTKESSAAMAIPLARHGNTEDKYQIISIPLQLDNKAVESVFSDLAPYNKELWRLYNYANNDNREYPAFSEIKTGWGYWLITLNSTTIKPGAGTTTRFANEATDQPFQITLKPGWNLIGNPYNFPISWEDVREANDDVKDDLSDFVSLYTTDGILDDDEIQINAYAGGFVDNTSSSDKIVEIPVLRNNNLPGRISSSDVDLSSYNWHISIDISDGVMTNSTGGLGMNKQATLTGRDKFDRVPIPVPMEMFEIAFPHPEVEKDFAREIVPSADSYVWDFEIHKTSGKPLTLSWDPQLIKETDKQLFLLDPSFGTIKDMKVESSFIIPSSTNSVKVIFGDAEHIQNALDELLPLAGSPYPNPALYEVRIPFHIPSKAGKMNVDIDVINSHGSKVATLANGNYESGSHEVVWSTQGKGGLYIVQIKVGTDKPKWAKIVVN